MTGEGEPRLAGGAGALFALGLILLATAGFVDAAGFLGSGLFSSFMSGDSTQLSVGLTRGMDAHVGVLAGVIVIFTAGAFLGRLLRLATGRRSPILGAEAVLLVIAALCARHDATAPALAAAALAMGAQTTVLTHAGGATVGATYVTGALARLGSGLADALAGADRTSWIAYLSMWIALAAGAAAGALCYARVGLESLWAAAVVCAALAVATRLAEPRRNAGRTP